MSVAHEQIDLFVRFSVPYLVMFSLFILNTVSLSFPFAMELDPPLLVMMIYYWAIYRPTLIPSWLVFTAGIVFDLLSFLPVGLHGFVFLALRWIVVDQRLLLASQSFLAVWIGFIVASLAAIAVEWFLFGLIHFQWTPVYPPLMMFATGVFLFPVIHGILHLSHRALPEFPDQYRGMK